MLSKTRQEVFNWPPKCPPSTSRDSSLTQTPLRSSKRSLFLAGPPMGELTETPKSCSKGIQSQSQALLYGRCFPTSLVCWIWTVRNVILGSKFGYFSIDFHMLATIPMYLQSLKDVCSVFIVFDNCQDCV